MKPIKTEKGLICGIETDDCVEYRGIPYAKPPIGELRWKVPVEVEPWDGVLHADTFGDICMQELPDESNPILAMFHREFYSDPDWVPKMSEDCLHLNIWTPKEITNRKLPVAVWIHGGAFQTGFDSEKEFGGAAYCKNGVILVSVDYRLNVYGFLTHPWLKDDSLHSISGNYGSFDQIMALKWVYRNISAFGGDPEQITLMGQSAGAMSTEVLLSSPLTGNIIKGAILQSGVSVHAPIFPTPTMDEEEIIGKKFVEYTKVKDINELRNLSCEKIGEAKKRLDKWCFENDISLSMVPNVDGVLLNESVKDSIIQGRVKKIPYLLGTVGNELGNEEKYIHDHGHGILYEECLLWAKYLEQSSPSYVYYFNPEIPGDNTFGAFHTSELWYTFGTLDRCWRPWKEKDYHLSNDMVSYWTNFIKTGNPNDELLEKWTACTGNNQYVKEFK